MACSWSIDKIRVYLDEESPAETCKPHAGYGSGDYNRNHPPLPGRGSLVRGPVRGDGDGVPTTAGRSSELKSWFNLSWPSGVR